VHDHWENRVLPVLCHEGHDHGTGNRGSILCKEIGTSQFSHMGPEHLTGSSSDLLVDETLFDGRQASHVGPHWTHSGMCGRNASIGSQELSTASSSWSEN